MTDEPDEELVQKSLNGYDSAFAELITRYQKMVYAIAIGFTKNFADAQDLSQDVFVNAYLRLKSLRNPSSFGSWIRKIAFNRCLVHNIQNQRTTRIQETCKYIPSDPVAQVEQELTQADLWAALHQLPDDQRLILVLFYLEERSYQEITDYLNIPRTTVQSRLRSARKALKKEMIAFMKKELQSNRLPAGFPKDTVKAARELSESLIEDIPIELIKSIRRLRADGSCIRSDLFKTFYDSLSSDQREIIKDKQRRLHFGDLTVDQQVYLKQIFHQMWMWEIADLIVNPPFYVNALEDCNFALDGGSGKTTMMEIREGTRALSFGVTFAVDI